MKLLFVLGAWLTFVTVRAAEPAADPATDPAAISTNLPPVAIQTGTISRTAKTPVPPGGGLPEVPPGRTAVGGAIPKLFRSDRPLQQINPLAPPEYGDGTDVVSRDLITGQPQGVTLFSISLPGKAHKSKAKTQKRASAPSQPATR